METTEYLRFILALIAVLGLIGLCAVVVRKLGLGQPNALAKGRSRRLKIEEVLQLDPKRRAVLFRCDDREHLVILGAGSEIVVEAGQPAPQEQSQQPGPNPEGPTPTKSQESPS